MNDNIIRNLCKTRISRKSFILLIYCIFDKISSLFFSYSSFEIKPVSFILRISFNQQEDIQNE